MVPQKKHSLSYKDKENILKYHLIIKYFYKEFKAKKRKDCISNPFRFCY